MSMCFDQTLTEVVLDPGEYFVGGADFKVRTLLGSCVAMVLWHPRMRYGAMSHFLLSSRESSKDIREMRGAEVKLLHLDGKYADEVLELMMRELRRANVPLHECVAKVFGGGNMFPQQKMADNLNVGKKNGETAKRLLRDLGFRIVAEDLFGNGHRQVIFNVCNGDVWSKQDNQFANHFTSPT